MMAGKYVEDLLDQPRAIRDTAAQLASSGVLGRARAELEGAGRVVLTGMGSSLFALYGLHLRRLAVWIEAGELLHHAADRLEPEARLVVASQSGETIEVVRLLERLPAAQRVVGITNHPESTLGRRGDPVLALAAGPEGGVASKTYVSTLAAALLLDGAASSDDVDRAADALDDVLSRREDIEHVLLDALGERPRELFLVGRGPSYGSAMTGALMLKEGSHTAAQALSGGAVRHGPLEMVSDETAALLFAPRGPAGDLVRGLAVDLADVGVRVVVVGPEPAGDLPLIRTPELPEQVAPLCEIAAAELLVVALARAKGHEPGVFRRIGKVTTTE
jgi:glucosamine--fructose-6-phosphate aminotransferase (isomerizing)